MPVFVRAMLGGMVGKVIITLLLALLVTFGFSPEWIVASALGNKSEALLFFVRLVSALGALAIIFVFAWGHLEK